MVWIEGSVVVSAAGERERERENLRDEKKSRPVLTMHLDYTLITNLMH